MSQQALGCIQAKQPEHYKPYKQMSQSTFLKINHLTWVLLIDQLTRVILYSEWGIQPTHPRVSFPYLDFLGRSLVEGMMIFFFLETDDRSRASVQCSSLCPCCVWHIAGDDKCVWNRGNMKHMDQQKLLQIAFTTLWKH